MLRFRPVLQVTKFKDEYGQSISTKQFRKRHQYTVGKQQGYVTAQTPELFNGNGKVQDR